MLSPGGIPGSRFLQRLSRPLLRDYSMPVIAQCLVAIVWFWLVTAGTGQMSHGGFFLSRVYDSVARSLLELKTDVEPREIRNEAFVVNGRVHTYFGIFPALLRVIPNALLPEYYGQWNRLSCFIAAVLSILAFHALLLLRLQENAQLQEAEQSGLVALLVVGFGLGTPIVFILSTSMIYHEAIMWGLAGSTSAILFFFRLLRQWGARSECLLSCSVAVALLSRASFGLPLYPAHLGMYLWQRRTPAARRAKPRMWTVLPAILGLLLQLWTNHDRFHNIFTFRDLHYNNTTLTAAQSAERMQKYEKYGEFNIRLIATNSGHYLGVERAAYSSTFPFVRMAMPEPPNKELYEHREATLPLTVSSPWLLCFGTMGLMLVMGKGRLQAPLGLLVACLVGQCGLILMFNVITERYTAEFMPLLVTLGAAGLPWLGASESGQRWAWTAFSLVMTSLVGLSIYVSVFTTVAWVGEYLGRYPNWVVPESFSRTARDLLETLNHHLVGHSR